MNTEIIEINPRIDDSWKKILSEQFESASFRHLKKFLLEETAKYPVYPPGKYIFSAFNLTPFDKVKVVIIGQDPYHGKGQAHGLCFSVQEGVHPPPSLVNIFKELHADLGLPIPKTGNLEPWAKQGVLLLNATLTVRANQPGSHQNKGWEAFTDFVIKKLAEKKSGLVFLLWGRFAQTKEKLIDANKHYILKAAHPSPLAGGAFSGCRHFSKTNELLRTQGIEEIDWRI